MSVKYKTHKTPVNRNNLIGLPLTVLSLDEDAEAAVFEMGMILPAKYTGWQK